MENKAQTLVALQDILNLEGYIVEEIYEDFNFIGMEEMYLEISNGEEDRDIRVTAEWMDVIGKIRVYIEREEISEEAKYKTGRGAYKFITEFI